MLLLRRLVVTLLIISTVNSIPAVWPLNSMHSSMKNSTGINKRLKSHWRPTKLNSVQEASTTSTNTSLPIIVTVPNVTIPTADNGTSGVELSKEGPVTLIIPSRELNVSINFLNFTGE